MDVKPVSVTAWGELRAERNIGRALRVMVNGQAAGGAERTPDGWAAVSYTTAMRDRVTQHATADDAVQAVIRSPWARKLGARATSRVYWSARAVRRARGGR